MGREKRGLHTGPCPSCYLLACADDTKVVIEAIEGNSRASATAVTVSR
jgi:hypothetical protein